MYKHTSVVGLGAEASPKMSRPKVLSVGKGHVASQNESGPTRMAELYQVLKEEFEMNRRLDKRNNDLERMDNHRITGKKKQGRSEFRGLQLLAHQSRLAVKADVFQDNKTRERKKNFATYERLGDISTR